MQPTVKVLGPGDLVALSRVAEGVFDKPIDDRWAAEFLADPRHHLAVALDGGLVVGMASGVHYVHPDKRPELWINEVGVAPTHRGLGLAGRLVRALLDAGRDVGCLEAWVLTERDNVPARRLYASAGGLPRDVAIYSFDLRDDGQRDGNRRDTSSAGGRSGGRGA